jgi:hypothetical protein
LCKIEEYRRKSNFWKQAQDLNETDCDITDKVQKSRRLCEQYSEIGPVWNAYGGYYFSPLQALTFDHMLSFLPKNEHLRTVCIATIISTASKCAASPGHTAQPFQPTETSGQFIESSWSNDPIVLAKKDINEVCLRHAKVKGDAFIADALDVASKLSSTDLVFIDPPYSDVQYSRFYHVLETIARLQHIDVNGTGRYPPISQRPQSGFSRKGDSLKSLKILLQGIRKSGSKIIFTFPKGDCSNGLSGNLIKTVATELFRVEEQLVDGRFSTLGGNNSKRASRMTSHEMILTMTPK